MNDIEDRLRVELQLLTDGLFAPPLADQVMNRAKRRRRIRQSVAAGGTALLVALVVLVVNVLHNATTNSEPTKPAPVGSYFPAMQPALPNGLQVRPLPSSARPSAGPTRDQVIASIRAFNARLIRGPAAVGRQPTSPGRLASADLVLASAPAYQPSVGEKKLERRVVWMLVSTGARYDYVPPYNRNCSVRAWWVTHKANCAALLQRQQVKGARFEFVDASTGDGLLALGTKDGDPHFAATVSGYIKPAPAPPVGARTLDGAPATNRSNEVVTSAPASAHPQISKQQAYDAYSRHGLAHFYPLSKHPHSVELVEFWKLQTPDGGLRNLQDATWHRTNLVWLVTVRHARVDVIGGAISRPGTYRTNGSTCLGVNVYPVDATTGKGLFFGQMCEPTG